jgi:hypothetical protein
MRAHFFRTIVCIAVIPGLAWEATVISAARAGMVTTEMVLRSDRATPTTGRDRLRSFLRRQDVQAQLVTLGIDPAEAAARVENLSDAEVAPLVARIDSRPAGAGLCDSSSTTEECAFFGGAVVLAIIFLILVVAGLIWLAYQAVNAVIKDDEPEANTASPRVSTSNGSKDAIVDIETE